MAVWSRRNERTRPPLRRRREEKAAKSKKDPKARVVIGALMVTAIFGNNDVDVDTAGDADGGGGLSDASNAKCMHAVALAAHPVEASEHGGLAATLLGVRKSGL